ncbi:MAG: hypothetical protein IPG59_04540 [Candidatus Melainabacteria bacterium]|nr:MAG: hypothetical protein IPG59_04540 [Candidatus Melainabacteria bacterium]
MSRFVIVLLTLTVLLETSYAGAEAAEVRKWQGYLIDRQCADAVREDLDPKVFIQHHTKDCALMPNCRAKGYTLYSKHKWLNLDKRGGEIAVKVLKGSKRKSGFYVEVTGTLKDKILQTQSIKEIDEPKSVKSGDQA